MSTRATNPVTNGLLLKGRNAFLVADPLGSIPSGGGYGLYLEDTRHLSRYAYHVEGASLQLQAAGSPGLHHARVELVGEEGRPRLRREIAMASHLLETLYVEGDHEVHLRLEVEADFRDVFEVRGIVEPRDRVPAVEAASPVLTFAYDGGDGVRRWTRLSFHPPPDELATTGAAWRLHPAADRPAAVTAKVEVGTGALPRMGGMVLADDLAASLGKEWRERAQAWALVRTADPLTAAWLDRAAEDAAAILIQADGWKVPAAGLPWYATAFGRDSLIFGLETVHLRPDVSMDILRFLAAHQGRARNAAQEEEPGKILHEVRRGELAGEGRIPHTPYYGSVDATALFLCLLAEVHRWTGDQAFLRDLFPAAQAALAHLRAVMARSPGGFLAYTGGTPPGLRHQGWKDGEWGILRPDGSQPEPPIAPCEVQGYAHWALRAYAALADAMGHAGAAREARRDADALRGRFHDAFWMPREETYALALEGEGSPVGTVTSNPGHLLMTGILSTDRARSVADRLLQKDLFSGWGVRTLSAGADHYDPLSYHNGSVWPHDNALIAWGMARAGLWGAAGRLYDALRDASGSFPHGRLPELFSGGARREEQPPERVPEASVYQAWGTGVPFLLLRGFLGMEADAPAGVLRLRPRLPRGLAPLHLRDVRVGGAVLSLEARGAGEETRADVRQEAGPRVRVEEG